MASRFGVIQRGLAAQAQASKRASDGAAVKTSQLSNGVTVASVDSGHAMSTVGILVKAGSRHEGHDNAGVSHALRMAVGLATKSHSGFSLVKNVQQAGACLQVTGSREYTLYSSHMARNKTGEAMEHIVSTVDSPCFKTWEVADVVGKRMAVDLAKVGSQEKASELLHKAAFRHGLGNSIYSPEHMVGKHKPAMLMDFHAKNFSADKTFLVGMDIDHDVLAGYGEKLELAKSSSNSSSAVKYFGGGEERLDCGGKEAFVAIAAASAPATNVKEAVAFMLLQHVLGFTQQRVKYGTSCGHLQTAVKQIEGNHAVSAINYTYTDAGLIGAYIASESKCVAEVVSKVAACLRSVNVTEADLARAKKSIQLDVDQEMSLSQHRMETVAAHLAFGAKEAVTAKQMMGMFSQATLSDVKAAAKKLSNAQLSMGAAGNLSKLPYLDQL